jgi:hypothetical protein
MITFDDITPLPLAGQYWANLLELSLMRVIEGYPNPLAYAFTQWCLGQESETLYSFIPPLNREFKLLRWSYPYSDERISNDLGYKFKSRMGDILELSSGILAFVVIVDEAVFLYTDEQLPLAIDYVEPSVYTVVQRGPGPLEAAPPPKKPPYLNRYERVLNAMSNRSMPRPEDPLRKTDLPFYDSQNHRTVFTNVNLVGRWRHL